MSAATPKVEVLISALHAVKVEDDVAFFAGIREPNGRRIDANTKTVAVTIVGQPGHVIGASAEDAERGGRLLTELEQRPPRRPHRAITSRIVARRGKKLKSCGSDRN